ncbi:MAG TPA: hypothetical protein VNG51_27910 [Ktedonobacteraceae bacterium]|nr:hypothetical protein [Ktedonobacteraceae bacterium]
MGSAEQNQQQTEGMSVSLPINWHFPENLQSHYATNVLVQSGQFEIIISFFEAQVPLLLGQPEDNLAKLEQLGAIQAECVGKIIVSPEIVPTIIHTLQTGLENYYASKLIQQKETEDE